MKHDKDDTCHQFCNADDVSVIKAKLRHSIISSNSLYEMHTVYCI